MLCLSAYVQSLRHLPLRVVCLRALPLQHHDKKHHTSNLKQTETSTPPTIVTERSENTITETSDDNIGDSLVVPFIAGTVELDGIIDEAVWEEATKVPLTLLPVL